MLTPQTSNVSIGSLLPEITGLSGSITYTYVGAAPVAEPSAWALMIAGFGIIGTAMRGHRRVTLRNA